MQSANVKSNNIFRLFVKAHEKLADWVGGIANAVTSPQISLPMIFTSFFACLLLRNFLESFSQRTNVMLDYDTQNLMVNLAHFEASFVTIALILTLVLHFMINVPVVNMLKIVFTSFVLILLAPIIDLIISHGQGMNLGYFSPDQNVNLLAAYFTYCGDFIGATPGIRIEVAIGLLGIYFYTYSVSRNIFMSLVTVWVAYTATFIWGATPYIVKPMLEWTGLQYQFSGLTLLRYFLVLDFILALWIAYLVDKNRFITFFKEMPLLRGLHYEAIFLVGICLGLSASSYTLENQFLTNPALVGNGILLMIAIFFALLSARNIQQKSGLVFWGCALIYASLVGVHGIFLISLVVTNFYLYSEYPFQLKRIFILSKLVISVNSLVLMLLGFWLVTGNISDFPTLLYPVVLCGFTLAANFLDLDKPEVKSLPALIGMRKAQWFCAVFFFILYLSLYFVFKGLLLWLFVATGMLQAWFLTRKQYNELPILLINIGNMLGLMAYLLV